MSENPPIAPLRVDWLKPTSYEGGGTVKFVARLIDERTTTEENEENVDSKLVVYLEVQIKSGWTVMRIENGSDTVRSLPIFFANQRIYCLI